MNQPTREEFDEFKQEVRQEMRQLREQITEPIKITVDRPPSDSLLLQTIMTMVGTHATDLAVLKTDTQGVKADIKAIRESQADFRDKLQTMATKDDLAAIETAITLFSGLATNMRTEMLAISSTQEQILKLLQQKSGE